MCLLVRVIDTLDRVQQLEDILTVVMQEHEEVSLKTRKHFWRIVRDIKRDPAPSPEEIRKAAEIRDILFEIKRGKTYALWPTLALMFLGGITLSVLPYLYLLGFPLDWGSVLTWSVGDWILLVLRILCVFLGVALFYPIGRLIGSKYTGIRVVGVCRDEYYEPTLKIDYVTFLNTLPSKRKWFFFFGGIWTVITALLYWLVGLVIAFDFSGLVLSLLLFSFEAYVLASGVATRKRGEMGLFNRERKIEQAWRERLTE